MRRAAQLFSCLNAVIVSIAGWIASIVVRSGRSRAYSTHTLGALFHSMLSPSPPVNVSVAWSPAAVPAVIAAVHFAGSS